MQVGTLTLDVMYLEPEADEEDSFDDYEDEFGASDADGDPDTDAEVYPYTEERDESAASVRSVHSAAAASQQPLLQASSQPPVAPPAPVVAAPVYAADDAAARRGEKQRNQSATPSESSDTRTYSLLFPAASATAPPNAGAKSAPVAAALSPSAQQSGSQQKAIVSEAQRPAAENANMKFSLVTAAPPKAIAASRSNSGALTSNQTQSHNTSVAAQATSASAATSSTVPRAPVVSSSQAALPKAAEPQVGAPALDLIRRDTLDAWRAPLLESHLSPSGERPVGGGRAAALLPFRVPGFARLALDPGYQHPESSGLSTSSAGNQRANKF